MKDSKSPSDIYTKREVASCAAKVFDPIGLITPFTVRSKMLFQRLWNQGIGWDDPVPPEICQEWLQWLREIEDLKGLCIPRCYLKWPTDSNSKLELHAFVDASQLAYASTVYIRAVYTNGSVSTGLVMSKTRIAPVKRITLPRLELLGATITARLCNYVKNSLDWPISSVTCWTDNSSILHWIRGSASQWKPFVSNRVVEIQSLTDPSCWRFCPGAQNPADLPTRGMSVEELSASELWWQGPPWLRELEEEWPPDLKSGIVSKDAESERKNKVKVSCVVQPIEPFMDYERYGDYDKLLRIIARVKRFAYNSRVAKDERIVGPLTGVDMQDAEKTLIARVQTECFTEELASLRHGTLAKGSKLTNLSPFVEESSGLLCVGGRIHKAMLPEDEKHPIILPRSHPVVDRLISSIHRRELHAGVEHTLSVTRQRFWIIKGRSTVRQSVKRCLLCRHYNTQPFRQRMAPLPQERVVPSPPFTNIGLDFAGPLYLKDSKEKAYICLFTCAVSRADHLELVSNMTVERFLLALRRMVARRGMCSIIWSDNARTFQCANRELQQCWKVIESSQTQIALAERKIQWKFIAPRAPWWGGFYERLVKSVKLPLKKIFGKAMLDAEHLSTILSEIEAQINSRPLTHVGAEPSDLEVLTPAQVLIGRNLQQVPTKEANASDHTSSALRKRFVYRQRLVNGFWKRWNAEYLKSLITLKQWTERGREIKVDDLVLISEDNVARGHWQRARVEAIHEGRDGLVRSVTLILPTGKRLRRPVQRLHLLETSEANSAEL